MTSPEINMPDGAQAVDSSGAKPTNETVKPTNPQQVPETSKVQDAGRFVLPERDESVVPIDATPTVQFTSGSMRPIMARKALAGIRRAQQWNANDDTLSVEPLALFADDVGVTLAVRGCNFINPFSLPVLDAADFDNNTGVVVEATLAAKYFQGNGPSVSTPGTVKRAEVEAKMNVLKSIVVGYYNRSIPFTDYGIAGRLLALSRYERELLQLQLVFNALSQLKSLADYQVKLGLKLSSGWQAFYEPGLYSKLAQLYQMVAGLPIVDKSAHDRLEHLMTITGACKDQEYPGALHMQNCGVFCDPEADGKTVASPSGSYPTSLTAVVDPYTTCAVWAAAADGRLEVLVNSLINEASSIITQYEVVYSALTQLISKGAMEGHYLSEWIHGDVDGSGSYCIQTNDPVFDWAAHERFEYAPVRYRAEVGATGATAEYVFKLFDLPAYNASGASASLIARRPVGKGHYDEAFTIREMVGIGLFRDYVGTIPSAVLAFVNAAGSVVRSTVQLPVRPWVDAVFGDFYCDATLHPNGVRGAIAVAGLAVLYGLSFYPSGLHNVIDMPFSQLGAAGVTTQGFQCFNGTAIIISVPAFSSAQDEEGLRWLYLRLCEQLNLHSLVVPRTNATGTRQLPLVVQSGYAMCDNFEFSMIAVDNALANAYGEFILDFKMREVKPMTK